MPATYVNIASQTLSTAAASVTFSSIPSTYTDLVLKASVRDDTSGTSEALARFWKLSGDTGTTMSQTDLLGSGSAVSSTRRTSQDDSLFVIDRSGATSNTFSNTEIYIPSYTVSQNKPISIFSVDESNTTAAYMRVQALLWRNTGALSSFVIQAYSGTNFVSGSSFYLYGIKNS
jgi:hypothetical protein